VTRLRPSIAGRASASADSRPVGLGDRITLL